MRATVVKGTTRAAASPGSNPATIGYGSSSEESEVSEFIGLQIVFLYLIMQLSGIICSYNVTVTTKHVYLKPVVSQNEGTRSEGCVVKSHVGIPINISFYKAIDAMYFLRSCYPVISLRVC
jgi:hypothetical protein